MRAGRGVETSAPEGPVLLFELSSFVLAVAASTVVRAATGDELSRSWSRRNGIPLLTLEGSEYSAWDLRKLLGLQGPSRAWLFLSVSRPGGPVPVAVSTGRCLSVVSAAGMVALPRGVFNAQGRAITAAIPFPHPDRPDTHRIALLLEPTRLWPPGQLEAVADRAREPVVGAAP